MSASRAPVRRPNAVADSVSARPLQPRTTVDGDTVRSEPPASRLRDSRSTIPSCQSCSEGSSTSNGATASRSASSGRAARARYTNAPATPANRTTAAATNIAVVRERRAAAGACTGRTASRNSAAERKRSSGDLASARAIVAASAGGVSGRSSRSGRGSDVRCAAITACADGPVNGGRPASISYPSTPNA